MNQKSPEEFGFSIIDIGVNDFENLKTLIKDGHEVTIRAVMSNGNLQGVVTPAI